MAVKGSEAKMNVVKTIKEAFGNSYLGESGNKYYVLGEENGEKIQIAITLTCPKNPITVFQENQMNYNDGIDFNNTNTIVPPTTSAEITDEERKNVRELMAKLGL